MSAISINSAKQRFRISLQAQSDYLRQQFRLRVEAPIQQYRVVEMKNFEPFPGDESTAPRPKRDFNPAPTNFRLDVRPFNVAQYVMRSHGKSFSAPMPDTHSGISQDVRLLQGQLLELPEESNIHEMIRTDSKEFWDDNKSRQPDKLEDSSKSHYPTFVNRYQKRSNNGIPIFSQERIDERASKRMEEMKKLMQEKQDKEASGFSDEVQLQRLLALTKSLQQQEENTRRYKLDETGTTPGSTLVSFKHGYTHAASHSPHRGLPVHLEYTVVEETGSTDEDDRCKHGSPTSLVPHTQATIKTPYTLMSPYGSSASDSYNSGQVKYRMGSKVRSPVKSDPPVSTGNSKHNNVYLRTGSNNPSGTQHQMRKPVSADVFSSSGLQRPVRTSNSENGFVHNYKKSLSSDSPLTSQYHHRNPSIEDIPTTKPLAKRFDGSVADGPSSSNSNSLTPAYTDVLLERLRMHNHAMATMKHKGTEKKLGQSKYE